jgi:hypothetical protein
MAAVPEEETITKTAAEAEVACEVQVYLVIRPRVVTEADLKVED